MGAAWSTDHAAPTFTMNDRFIKVVLYNLKRTFGQSGSVYQPSGRSVNRESGAISQNLSVHDVDKIILLPERFSWNDVDGAKFTKVNADFKVGDREFIIDLIDLPSAFNWSQETYLLVDSVRYNTVTYQLFPNKCALYVVGRNE